MPIENNTDIDDIVYDPFCGSGTAIIACERTGRIARTIEIEPKYCDIILHRYEQHTGQSATGKTATLIERQEHAT